MRLWLIDAGYLFNGQRALGPGYRLDYLKLRRKLEESGPIWRAYYLNSTLHSPSEGQDGFHAWLQSARGPKFIVKLYGLKAVAADKAFCTQCNAKVNLSCPNGASHALHNQHQKGVDVGLATLALRHRDQYETLVVSSGDGDLLDAFEYLSEHGKRIELAVFNEGVSTDLQARSDRIHWINEFAEEVRRD